MKKILKDLSKIKRTITNNLTSEVKNIFNRYIGTVPQTKFPLTDIDQANNIDLFSTALIPDNIPLPNNEVFALNIKGDRNCLFNLLSTVLVGDNILAGMLRLLTAGELYFASRKAHNFLQSISVNFQNIKQL